MEGEAKESPKAVAAAPRGTLRGRGRGMMIRGRGRGRGMIRGRGRGRGGVRGRGRGGVAVQPVSDSDSTPAGAEPASVDPLEEAVAAMTAFEAVATSVASHTETEVAESEQTVPPARRPAPMRQKESDPQPEKAAEDRLTPNEPLEVKADEQEITSSEEVREPEASLPSAHSLELVPSETSVAEVEAKEEAATKVEGEVEVHSSSLPVAERTRESGEVLEDGMQSEMAEPDTQTETDSPVNIGASTESADHSLVHRETDVETTVTDAACPSEEPQADSQLTSSFVSTTEAMSGESMDIRPSSPRDSTTSISQPMMAPPPSDMAPVAPRAPMKKMMAPPPTSEAPPPPSTPAPPRPTANTQSLSSEDASQSLALDDSEENAERSPDSRIEDADDDHVTTGAIGGDTKDLVKEEKAVEVEESAKPKKSVRIAPVASPVTRQAVTSPGPTGSPGNQRGLAARPKKKKSKKKAFGTMLTWKKKNKKDLEARGRKSIGLPTQAKHEGHLGFNNQGFEARNLPPALQELFANLNDTLKAMGMKGITKSEAQFLLKHAIAQMDLSSMTGTAVKPQKVTVEQDVEKKEEETAVGEGEAEKDNQTSAQGWAMPKKQVRSGKQLLAGRRAPSRMSISTDMVSMKSMRNELDVAKEQLLAKEGEVASLQEGTEKQQRQNEHLRHEMEMLREKLKESEAECQRQREEKETLRESLEEANAKLLSQASPTSETESKLEEAVQHIRQDAREKVEEYKQRMAEMKAELEDRDEEAREANDLLENSNSLVDVLQAENKLQETKYARIKELLAQERQRLDDMEVELAEAKVLIKENEASISNSSAMRESLEDQNAKLKEELGGNITNIDASMEPVAPPSAPPPPPAPVSAPAPPRMPVAAPPPPMPKSALTNTSGPSGNGSGGLLDAIRNQGAANLRHVEKEEKEAAPVSDGSVLGLLAKAIIDRRVQMREEGNDEDDDDDLLWD